MTAWSAARSSPAEKFWGRDLRTPCAVSSLGRAEMNKVRAVFVVVTAAAVSAFGQDRSLWRTSADIIEGGRGSAIGTVSDLQPGRNRIELTPDDSPNDRIIIDADAVSTQYNGFGGTI